MNKFLENFNHAEELLALLNLNDDEFSAISSVMLRVLEDELSRPLVRNQIIQESVGPLLSVEDFTKSINENLNTELSQIKMDFITQVYALIYNIIEENNKENHIAVAIEKINDKVKLPIYANETDAGMDVYALEDITILPGETKLIKTGIKMAIPTGYELQVRPRSGNSLKTKLRIANTPGTIDSGYRDEIGIIVENIDNPIRDIKFHYDDNQKLVIDSIATGAPMEITEGQRIAQLVLCKVYHADFYKVDSVENIGENRGGGFGSSGK